MNVNNTQESHPPSPSEMLVQWAVERFVPPGVKPHKVFMRPLPNKKEASSRRTKGMDEPVGSMIWPNLHLLFRRLAEYDLVRMFPKRSHPLQRVPFGELMDELLILEEQMDAEDLLRGMFKAPNPNEELPRLLLSFSNPVFSKGGIVIVGIEIRERIPAVSRSKPSIFASLFGKSPGKPKSRTDASPSHPIRDIAWIGLYRENNENMVMDPERDAGPCSLDEWLQENDFGFDRVDNGSSDTNGLVVFGVGSPSRKPKKATKGSR